jgi:NAD(P)-dependent dehydrogenase (short-subunit alcohol dehydrogenase family)
MVKGGTIVAQAFVQNKAEKSTFINISSSAAHIAPVPGFSSYAVAKTAMVKVTDYLQYEHKDVRVLDIHPGTIETKMSLGAKEEYNIPFQFDDCESPN